MADIAYNSSASLRSGASRPSFRHGLLNLLSLAAGLKGELAEQRRRYRIERALRALDSRQLRDIGIDRGAC